MRRFMTGTGLWAAFCLAVVGCAGPATSRQSDGGVLLDLAGRFSPVTQADRLTESGSGFLRNLSVTRKGRREEAVVLVAPLSARVDVTGVTGAVSFEALVAPVFNIGDGIKLEILLSDTGREKLLYERHFDAGRQASDREWTSLEVPIDLGTGGSLHLEMRVSAGRSGDLTGDWLALARARLRRRG